MLNQAETERPPAAPPAMSKSNRLDRILTRLTSSSPEVLGAAVVSRDGLLIASSFPAGLEEERVAAMAAAILGLAERAIKELERGDFEQVLAKGSDGYLLMVATGDEGMLTAMCARNAKLGLVLLDMQRAAAETAEVF